MLDSLVAIFAPHECLGCSAEGALLCSGCLAMQVMPAERCFRCRSLSGDGRTCLACRRISKLYSVHSAASYDGVAKELITRLKFSGAQAAVRPMVKLMLPLLTEIPAGVVITALPTASRRVRQRGYDQAAILARELAKQSGLAYLPVLVRTGQQRQTGASRALRLKQMQEVLMVAQPTYVKDRHIIVIDDVLTTGASLEAAAGALKAAGAKRVTAITFARA